MERRLFEDLVVSARRRRRRDGYALPASLAAHAAVIGAAILLPALGPVELVQQVAAGPQPPVWLPPPPPRVPVADPAPRPRPPAIRSRGTRVPPGPAVAAAPAAAPSDTPGLPEPEDVLQGSGGCLGVECLVGDASEGPWEDAVGPPGPGAAEAPRTVRPYEGIAPPQKLEDVAPVYPELAKRAGVEGIVIIECTIDPQGRIAGARVLRGHPLLDAAALEAVRQWRYRPTLLNGAPVSVVMTVTVKFFLAR